MPESDDVLKSRFNRETAKISWRELQRFYARGVVVEVAADMDLIAVAIAMHRDDKAQVADWLQADRLRRVDDERAAQWLERDDSLWATVVAPWVLVQAVRAEDKTG